MSLPVQALRDDVLIIVNDNSLDSLLVGAYYAQQRGIILADTKVEFGLVDDRVTLIDELLTPDSSRLWDTGLYQVGCSQQSFDKQPIRDWLVQAGWDKEPPAPMLPESVIAQTTEKYRAVYHRLTGKEL